MPALEEHAAPDRSSRKRARTRMLLLEAAAEAFARGGVDATTIAEITEGADVGLGTFYNYFSSKDDIADAAVAHLVGLVSTELRDAAAGHAGEPARALAAVVLRAFDWHDRNPVWGRLLLQVGLDHQDLVREFGALLFGIVEEGVAAGDFRPEHARLAPISVAGLVVAGLQFRHDGAIAGDAATGFASHALRLLGVHAARADEIAASIP